MNPKPPSDRPAIGAGSGLFPLPAERSSTAGLKLEIEGVTQNVLVDGLLEAVHGLMAVLNERRQILAINASMLQSLGISDAGKVFGLRPGEAVHCLHAETAPGGCGTTEFCSTCGAAISQAVALAENRSIEQLCAIEVAGDEPTNNLFFRVRASPLNIEGQRLILLFLQDVSSEQRAASLEQTFLHDLRNTTMGISVGTALLADNASGENIEIARDVMHLATRLAREIELQRCLAHSTINSFQCLLTELSLSTLFDELHRSCRHHPALEARHLEITPPRPDRTLSSDATILHRILYNMVLNALEASASGETVKVTSRRNDGLEIFEVWNASSIRPEIARRIFQRNFSTKGTLGHGLGTYSMKLLGEKLLAGRVSFTTSPEQGTCFKLELRA